MTDPITDPRGIVLLDEGDPRATTCPVCSKSWDDSVPTGWTPAPAGRCPWEYEHPAANDAQGYPWAEKTASDLWSDLLVAVGDSEWLYDAFQSLAVRVGILDECPRCEHTVEVGEPVDPCECCEGDDEPVDGPVCDECGENLPECANPEHDPHGRCADCCDDCRDARQVGPGFVIPLGDDE